MAYKYLIAKCPLCGGEYTASDWWEVVSRHTHYDSAEESMFTISNRKKRVDKHIIFELTGYAVGERFNIKAIQDRHKKEK